VLLLLAALAGVVSAFPTYLEVDGQDLVLGGSLLGVLATLLVPLAGAAVGVLLLRGAVPKFGLAYAAVAGALALGNLLIELYRGRSSTDRPGVEVLGGRQVLTSDLHIGAGWVAGVVALSLTVLAGGVAVGVWGRTVMDDRGSLDPVRGLLAGATVLLGVGTVLCLTLPAADVRDDLVLDPATGLQVVVTREGPQALLERPGLALLGGLLLAGALVLCSVTAPSLRPRLAAVGGLLAIAVTVLAAGLSGLRDAVASDDLDWTLPGVGLLLAGFGFVVLTVLAWRLRRSS
jgi:MFS family permease